MFFIIFFILYNSLFSRDNVEYNNNSTKFRFMSSFLGMKRPNIIRHERIQLNEIDKHIQPNFSHNDLHNCIIMWLIKCSIILLTIHIHMNEGCQRRLTLSQGPTTGINFSVHVYFFNTSINITRTTIGYNNWILFVVVKVIPHSTCEFGVQIATR